MNNLVDQKFRKHTAFDLFRDKNNQHLVKMKVTTSTKKTRYV